MDLGIDIVSLDQVDVDKLVLRRECIAWHEGQDHRRWIFESPRSERERLIYKVWNTNYVRRDNIILGLENGLYGPPVTPALRALIIHRGACRGYVMEFWQPNRRPSPEFIRNLWARTHRSGHFANQFRRSHTRRRGAKTTLIDLEGVFPIASFRTVDPTLDRIEDPHYSRLVEQLADGDLPASDVQRMADSCISDHAFSTHLSPDRATAWVGRKLDGLQKRLDWRLAGLRRPPFRSIER